MQITFLCEEKVNISKGPEKVLMIQFQYLLLVIYLIITLILPLQVDLQPQRI